MLFKRTFTSLYSKIDQMVGEIENHDALIQAAIAEQKGKIASAKIQLRRLQENSQRTQEQIAQLSSNEKQWTQRAAKEASGNEEQALACLQRRQKIRQQIDKLRHIQREYEHSATSVKSNITQCEDDLARMVQKHQILRARQSTAEAMQIIDSGPENQQRNLESSFDRWEVKISQGEVSTEYYNEVDILEQDYLSEENEQDLRAQLADLLLEEKLGGAPNTDKPATEGNH